MSQQSNHEFKPGPARPPGVSFEKLFFAVRGWSEHTFGDAAFRGPTGPLDLLRKKAAQAEEAWAHIREAGGVINPAIPDAVKAAFLEKLADLQILLFDVIWRAHIHPFDFLRMTEMKLLKNLNRAWPPPAPDGPVRPLLSVWGDLSPDSNTDNAGA